MIRPSNGPRSRYELDYCHGRNCPGSCRRYELAGQYPSPGCATFDFERVVCLSCLGAGRLRICGDCLFYLVWISAVDSSSIAIARTCNIARASPWADHLSRRAVSHPVGSPGIGRDVWCEHRFVRTVAGEASPRPARTIWFHPPSHVSRLLAGDVRNPVDISHMDAVGVVDNDRAFVLSSSTARREFAGREIRRGVASLRGTGTKVPATFEIKSEGEKH